METCLVLSARDQPAEQAQKWDKKHHLTCCFKPRVSAQSQFGFYTTCAPCFSSGVKQVPGISGEGGKSPLKEWKQQLMFNTGLAMLLTAKYLYIHRGEDGQRKDKSAFNQRGRRHIDVGILRAKRRAGLGGKKWLIWGRDQRVWKAEPRPVLAFWPQLPIPSLSCHFLSARRLLFLSARPDSAQLGPTCVDSPSSAVSPRPDPAAGPGPSHSPAPCRSAPPRPRVGYWQRDNLPCQQKKPECATEKLSGGQNVQK